MQSPPIDLPADMLAIEIASPGGPEMLRATRRATPAPAASEIVIKVEGAGVNRPDVLQRLGLYPPPPGASDIPGLEVAGEVVAIGANVSRWKMGDRVCALLTGGGYAEYALADEGSCLPIPAGLSTIAAAGLPETFFTVWANAFEDGDLKRGETLLVHGGTSGIGVTAILMAKARGASVMATAGSDAKVAAIWTLGADAAFNYASDDWDIEIQRLGGVDVVLDMTGGDFVARNIACLRPGGRHVSIAFQRGDAATFSVMAVMRKRLRLSGSTMKTRTPGEKSRIARALENEIWPLIESGAISPRVDQIFPLTEARRAHELMESGAHLGKIVLSATQV